MPPNSVIAKIHDRMPAILRFRDHHTWLNGTPDEAAACLQPYPDELLELKRVSTRVNSTKNNDAGLIEPEESGGEEQ